MKIEKIKQSAIYQWLRLAYNCVFLPMLFRHDRKIFEKAYAGGEKQSQQNFSARFLFFSHQLEKSMSRTNFSTKHGKNTILQIRRLLDAYEKEVNLENCFGYIYILSALREYAKKREAAGDDLVEYKNILGKWFGIAKSKDGNFSGFRTISKESKINNKKADFKTLFNNRWAIREYSNAPVKLTKIKDAIELAMKTPSVCNRQDARVYCVRDPNTIGKVLRVQAGFGGYPIPPVLLLVTSDNQNFLGINERNQAFVDGGLFGMSLLLSLEYYGLAACPLHAMLSVKGERAIREYIDVKPTESLVMFVAVGNFREESLVAASARLSGESVTKLL